MRFQSLRTEIPPTMQSLVGLLVVMEWSSKGILFKFLSKAGSIQLENV